MPGQMYDRNELLMMLRWQFDLGIDEALLDSPDLSLQPIRLERLLAQRNATANSTANPNPGVIPQKKTKQVISKNGPRSMVLATEGPVLAWPTSLLSITTLVDLRAGLTSLDDCSLKHTASNMCFSDGNPGARVMVIGEVPGRDEDRMGIPFVGKVGQLLDKMLASIGHDRTSTYLVNLLPWRPPGNRSPTEEELAILTPWLFRHVQLVNPDFVLLMGGAAAKLVFASQDGIMKLRGRWRDIDFGDRVRRPTLATLHPAYLLRSPAQKRLVFQDLLLLAKHLNSPPADDKSS